MDDFIRDIIEFFRDPENIRRYEEWRKQQKDGEASS